MRAEGAPFRAQFYRKNRLNFSLALLASLLTAALNLAIAWLLREMIDAVSGVTGAPGLRDLALLIAALLALIAAVKALEYYSKPRFMQRAMLQYKDFAFERLLTAISAFAGLSGVVAQLGTFFAGAWLAHAGMELTPGALIVFIDLTASVINPIREFPGLIAARKAASALTDKLAEALSVSVRDEGSPIPERLERGIELRDLSFAYEPGREVLHGITADFAPGRSTAVVGASGSGKSTLLRLLTAGHGSYTGEILIDGRELREISGGSLCELISVVEQNVFIFNASIRDNITMFQSFPQEEVERAIELSGLAALIEERGEGYLCGENGSGLSGGEKQRISIARSLIRRSQVLLADEATAALDAASAFQVSSAILGLDCMTRIVVTHSLDAALLRRYDSILVLKGGRIEEAGTFDELMSRRGYFHSLFTVSQ